MAADREQPQCVQQVHDLNFREERSNFGGHMSWEILQNLGDVKLDTNKRGFKFARGKIDGEEVVRKSARKDDIINEATIYRKLAEESQKREAPFVMLARAVLEDDSHIYIFMPLCRAGDVMGKLLREKSFSTRFIKKLTRQLLSGVVFLHSCNIGHMDLSLENLFLTEMEDIVIADFDQSKALTAQGALQYYDSLCGKPYTQAPEVLGLHGQTRYAAAPVDAYACGAMILTMLLGANTHMWSGFEDNREGLAWAERQRRQPPYCWIEPLMKRLKSDALEQQPAAKAKPLLQGLLHLDPQSRNTPARALKSQWLREATGEAAAVKPPPQPQHHLLVALQEQSDLLVDRH